MKRAWILVTAALLAVALYPPASAHASWKPAKSLDNIKTPELTWEKPEAMRRELPNGMIVYLLENHRLPLVNVQARVRTGSLYEPENEAGVAQTVGIMLRRGGTDQLSPDEVDEKFDFMAADVSTDISPDAGLATLNVPTDNFEDALALYAQLLMHPGFDEEQLEVARNQVKEGIRRQNDNPVQIAIREYWKLLYGPDHPAARTPTFETVDALNRQELVDFHAKYYHPNNVMLAVAGDFDPDTIDDQIMAAFAGWTKEEVSFPEIPEVSAPDEASVHYAVKDVPQSTILVGHLGTTLKNPDHTAIDIMNSILGGSGFSSRIVETIRNDRGLAYFAGSFYQMGTTMPGAFIGVSLTQADSTTVALQLLLDEIEKIRQKEVDEKELETARNMELNSEVFQYDNTAEVANRTMWLEYYGLPKDFLEKNLEAVKSIDRERVLEVAKEYP